jgi:putative salt-induced outer membrane protein YdiY
LLSGPVVITPGRVAVGSSNTTAYARDQLQGFTPGGGKERNYWSGNVSLGLNLRGGNTESVDYNASANLQRRTPGTRFSLNYIGNVSSVDSVDSANNHRVNSEFNLWISRRLYLVLPFAEYYRDPFQNLESRYTLGVGLGYDLIDRPKLEWNITAGPGYQYSEFVSVQPGEPASKGSGAMVFSSSFDWEITRRIELLLEYRLQYTSQEVGETTSHSVSTLSLELTKRFDLNVSFVWDRIANPKVSADGSQPEPNDYQLVLGLGVDF